MQQDLCQTDGKYSKAIYHSQIAPQHSERRPIFQTPVLILWEQY